MARAPAALDAFSAIAEPRRRQILDLLARGERPVNGVVELLGIAQPQVSKHLSVLRKVGLVSVRGAGQQRVYRLQPEGLQAIQNWVAKLEQHYSHQLDRIKARAERRAQSPRTQPDEPTKED